MAVTYTSRDLLLLKGLCNGLWTIPSGVDYSRITEWPLAANMLDAMDGMRVLDVGAGGQSMFPLLLAWKHDVSVVAMDWADSMDRLRHWHAKGKRHQRIRGSIHFVRGDVCRLPFAADSFDRISCVSTIEHMPAEGDFEAAREMARVLRPGGRLVVSIPFVAHGRNEFKRDHVYERHAAGKLVFFQRLYDFSTLTERIVRPSGLSLHTSRFLVEPMRRYFWEQDCERTEEEGETVLKDRGMNYGERCLRYLRAMRYTRVVDEPTARRMPEALFAACVTLIRPWPGPLGRPDHGAVGSTFRRVSPRIP